VRGVEGMATAFGIPPGGLVEELGRSGGATTGYRMDPLRGWRERLTGGVWVVGGECLGRSSEVDQRGWIWHGLGGGFIDHVYFDLVARVCGNL